MTEEYKEIKTRSELIQDLKDFAVMMTKYEFTQYPKYFYDREVFGNGKDWVFVARNKPGKTDQSKVREYIGQMSMFSPSDDLKMERVAFVYDEGNRIKVTYRYYSGEEKKEL